MSYGYDAYPTNAVPQLSQYLSPTAQSITDLTLTAEFLPPTIRSYILAIAKRDRHFMKGESTVEAIVRFITSTYFPPLEKFDVQRLPYLNRRDTQGEIDIGVTYIAEIPQQNDQSVVLVLLSEIKHESHREQASKRRSADQQIRGRYPDVYRFFEEDRDLRSMLGGKLRYVFALSFLGLSFRIYRYDLLTSTLIPVQLLRESQALFVDTAPRDQWAHHVLTQSGYDYLTAVFFTVYLQLRTVPTGMAVPKLPAVPFSQEAQTLAASMLMEDESQVSCLLAKMSADEYRQLSADAADANAEAAHPVNHWLGATPSPQEDRSGYRGRRAESMTSPAVTRRSTLPLRGDNADLYSPYTSPTIPSMGGSTTPLQHGSSQDPRTPSPPSSALSNSGVRSNASKSSARKHRQSRSQRYLVEDEDDYEHPVSSSGHYDSEGLSRFTNDQLTVALGNLSPESSRTLSTPPRPTVNSRPPVGIMDSLGLSPDHPSRVQVGVRLQQSMMNSHTSPARDNAGGGQRLLYPMAQAFPPIRGLNVPANFQTGVRVAESEEYDDLYTAEEEEAARRATQRAQPSRIRDPTRSSTAQSSPSRYLNDTAPASAHYPTSRSSGSARSIQRRARGYEEDSDGDNQ